VASLIQCGGLWFANGKFGVTWKLIQVVVQKPRASLSGQCFIKLKSSDKEKLKASPAPTGDVVDDEDAVHTAEVEDSDEEEDDEPVSAPVVPAPTPVVVAPPAAVAEEPKKKKVVKKKVLAEA
jgi:hypothetical protein